MRPTEIKINEKLHLVPASFTMTQTEDTDYKEFEAALKALLTKAEDYDFILLDAQAGTDNYAKITVQFAQQCVIVSEYDPVSAQGIERLKALFATVIEPSSTWILFNKVLPEFSSAIGEGLSIARYLTPIPWDADVVRAFARRDLAIKVQLPNPYTLAISQVAYTLFPDEAGNAIETWGGSAVKGVTTPVSERVHELEQAEASLENAKRKREHNETVRFLLGIVTASAALLVPVSLIFGFSGLFQRSQDVSVAAVFSSLAIATAAFFVLRLFKVGFVSKSQSRDIALELVHEEKQNLKVMLDAAQAMLKYSSSAGYYERRRREPIPDHEGGMTSSGAGGTSGRSSAP
jgi:hypothetical protein